MQDQNIVIKLNNMSKSFQVGGKDFLALKNINLSFQVGEFTGLIGPSGSGKTTLLNIIGSLDKPTKGEAIVLNKNITDLSHKQAAELRNQTIGFIFQSYNLLPIYTVYENVEFALILQNKSVAYRKKQVWEVLEQVGLQDLANKRPDKLSGGECQRVAIARAMVKKPKILLADEPTANLDAENAHRIMQTLKALNQNYDTTFIFSTHDEKVMEYLERKIVLRDGVVNSNSVSKIKITNHEISVPISI
ncbi:Lipoprotein-releasing system ATP-binding protein LolD [Tenacibaculum sp. 190524A02b]|uniref:ABC transporter ATP-binding protein n=2 Tax=Tenacibaculum vairaonense TaxID=3137860 RepID=UPI0031FA562D